MLPPAVIIQAMQRRARRNARAEKFNAPMVINYPLHQNSWSNYIIQAMLSPNRLMAMAYSPVMRRSLLAARDHRVPIANLFPRKCLAAGARLLLDRIAVYRLPSPLDAALRLAGIEFKFTITGRKATTGRQAIGE